MIPYNMKKLLPIAILTTLVAVSCKKEFIQLTPEDSYTAGNFYQTEAHFRSAVIAAYAPLRDVLINDYFTSEMHSDNTIYQPIPGNRGTAYVQREDISDFTNTSTNSYANATWQHSYNSIARCNIVIDRLPCGHHSRCRKSRTGRPGKVSQGVELFQAGSLVWRRALIPA